MSRSFLLLFILTAGAVGAGYYLDGKFKSNIRPQNSETLSTAGNVSSTTADLVPLTGMGTTQDGKAPDDKQIAILQSQIEYLEEQNKLLQQENSQLIDQLAALHGGKAPAPSPPLLSGCSPAPKSATTTDDAAPDFAGIGIELLRLRGLKDIPIPTSHVPAAQVEEKIATWLTTQFPADQGRKQGRALAALGAIPRPVDTIALKASFMAYQIGGWFDEKTQTLFLAQGVDGVAPQKENAMALSYGYLFKHYGPKLFTSNNSGRNVTLDARLARDAMISGDAAHLRFLHALQNPNSGGGGGVGEDPDDPSRIIPIPNFLREMELLPFSMGLDFMQAMHSIGEWDQVNATYSRPPISSAEIMDTQVYLQDTPFTLLPLEWADISLLNQEPFWDDRLGPLGTVLFLKQHVPEAIASETAPGWLNDRLMTYENKNRGRDHVIWQTLWKDNEAADGFFSAARSSFLGRNKDAEPSKNEPAGVFKLEAAGRVMLLKRTHEGRGVIYVDVASAEIAEEAIKKFGEG